MKKAEKFWDFLAKKFDKQVKNNFEKEYTRLLEITFKHLNISNNVLDFACGTGIVTLAIADKVKMIHAIDISLKMIAIAKNKAAECKIDNIYFAQSEIFTESLAKESFDVVIAHNILHLVENPLKVIQRINELLKPGGLIITVTPCQGEKKSLMNIFIFLLVKIGIMPYFNFFNIKAFKNVIANGNFQIIESERLLPESLDYFIIAVKPQ